MKNWIRIVKIAFSKKGLIAPVLFFGTELIFMLILNWQLFGEKYSSSNDLRASTDVHNPMIVISALHSERLTHPYGQLTPDVPMLKFYSKEMVLPALYFLASLVVAYLGMAISAVWINNYLKKNKRLVSWWIWPLGCFSAHILLFFMANSHLGHLFLKS